mgnify:CR=1 FL=1
MYICNSRTISGEFELSDDPAFLLLNGVANGSSVIGYDRGLLPLESSNKRLFVECQACRRRYARNVIHFGKEMVGFQAHPHLGGNRIFDALPARMNSVLDIPL